MIHILAWLPGPTDMSAYSWKARNLSNEHSILFYFFNVIPVPGTMTKVREAS